MPLANPQLAKINELYNLLSNSSSSDYLKRGEEPILEGLTPTLDLSLLREAQERTRGALVRKKIMCRPYIDFKGNAYYINYLPGPPVFLCVKL